MKNDLDSKLILQVYDYIQQYGEASEQGKILEGVTAFSDWDGYTIYLQGSGVLLRFGFHNKYDLTYDYEKQKGQFLNKLNAIAKNAQSLGA